MVCHEKCRNTYPLLPALAALTLASCDPGPPDSSTVEIDPAALTVFDEGEQLWGVRDVVRSGDAIWALTETEPFLRAYSPSGRLLAEFGSLGEGPGELRNPRAVSAAASDDGVVVWDLASGSRPVFTTEGALVSSAPVPNVRMRARMDIESVTFGDPFRLAEGDGGTLVVDYGTGPNLPDDMWSGTIVRVAADGSEPAALVDFDVDLEGAESRTTTLMGLAPVPLWDRCPDGGIAVLDPVAAHVRLFGPDGTSDVSSDGSSREPIPLPWTPRALLQEELLGYIRARMQAETREQDVSAAEIERAAAEAVANAGDMLPSETPLAVDLLCAGDRVWVQEFDGLAHPMGYGRAWWSVFVDAGADHSGSAGRVDRVIFPDRFAPYQITDSMAIGIVTDAMDLQRVAVVRLPE